MSDSIPFRIRIAAAHRRTSGSKADFPGMTASGLGEPKHFTQVIGFPSVLKTTETN
jgi:hypothetical protein